MEVAPTLALNADGVKQQPVWMVGLRALAPNGEEVEYVMSKTRRGCRNKPSRLLKKPV